MADDDIRLSLLADFRVAPSTDDPRGAVAGNSVAVVHKHGVVCVGAGSDLVCVDASVLATAAWARYDESRRPGGSKRREGAPPPALARATLMGACACCASASNANVVAAATGSDVTLFAVERGPSLRHVRTQHVTGVTSLTVSGDGVWVAASSPTSTVVFRVDGGGDVDLAAGHAAFCGTRLAVACANSVKAYALTNEVWREEGCVTPDGDAFGDDDPRTAHFVRWLDGDRVLAGFRHATDDALARCVVVDVSTCTVTTYAADLGDGVVAFFDREKEGAPHAFFGEVVRAGLAVVACNLSRDVGVIREDPEVSGAYYLHEAYDEASLVCQTPCQSHAGDERETLVAGLGVLARGVTRPAPPVDPSVPAPPDAPPAPLVLLLSTAGLLSCYALADDEKPAAQMAVEPPPAPSPGLSGFAAAAASDPPAPAKAPSKLSFGGATPASGYPPMPTKAPSKLPFGAPAPAAAAKSAYPPMPTKAPSKLPFGGAPAPAKSAYPPMPTKAPSKLPFGGAPAKPASAYPPMPTKAPSKLPFSGAPAKPASAYPPMPTKAPSKLPFGGAKPASSYPPMPTKAPSKLPFGAPAPAAAAKSAYPPMPTKAPSKLPFGGAKPTSASPPMPATAPSQVPAEAPPPTDLPPGWTMQIPKDEEEAEKWRAIREMEGAMARMRRELKVAQAAVAPHLAQGREDARKERALLAEARTTALGLEAQEREFGEARAALLGSVETVQRQNEETRANLDIAEGMMGDCTDPLLKAKAKAWEEVLEHQELDTASQQRLEKLTKLSSDVADKLAEVSLVNSHREALAKHKAPPMTTSFFGSPRDAPSFGTAKVKTETSDEAAFLRRVRATYEQTLDLQERIIPSLNERWDAACVERDRLMETKRAIPDRVQQAIDRDVLEAKGREPPEMEPWEQAFVRMCEENTPPIVTDCRPQSQKSRPLVPQRRATTEEPLSTHVEGLKGASAVPWAKVHREAVHASKLQAPRTPTSDLAASSAALGVSALSFTSPEAPAGPTFGKATPAPAPAAVGFGAAFGAALESTPAPAPAAVGFGGFGLGLDSPAPAPMPAKAPGALPFGTPAPAPAAPKASPFSNAFKLEGLEAALEAKTAATGATPAAAPAAPAFGAATPAPAPAAPAAALATTPFGTSGTFGAAAPAPPPVPTGFGAPAAGDPRARVVEIYQRCNPSKLGEVDKLLAKYAGKEAELVLRLQKKYAAQLGGTAGALGSPAAAAPVFGSPAAASPFGSAPAPAASPFGTAAAVSPFGAPAPAASPFGTAPAPAPFGGSTFGSPAALGTSTFGGTSTLGAAPAFGSPAALGAAPAFGSPAALGAAPFGGAATDARSKVVEIYQRCYPTKLGEVDKLLAKYAGREAELVARLQKKYAAQLSGGATFGGAAAAPSAGFGGMAAAPSARFGGFGGGAAAPSGFGQAAPLGGGSAFGGASPGGSFGAAAPAFGQPAAFGGAAPQAGFGAPSAFGQPQPAFGQTASPGAGFGQTAAPSGFGGFGGAPSPGFGGQPQQAAFGQPQQAAFGQPQQAAFGGGGFGAPAPAPAFGQPQQGASTFGRSFTQFRG